MFRYTYFSCCLSICAYLATGGVCLAQAAPQTAQKMTPDSATTIEDASPLLEPIIRRYDIPGMVAMVISGTKVKALGAVGVRKRGGTEKVTVNDLLHIGSDAKSMTATLIALLVEKGLLQWDTKVTDVFPALQGKIDPSYKSLTLQQLLTHRGGLPANLDFDKIQAAAKNDLVKARQMAMEQALAKPVDVQPGNFLYSNTGYVIAGHMAEKVTGRPWEKLMAEMIFVPLGMHSAGFGPPGDQQPAGHASNGKALAKGLYADNPAMLAPAGTVHVSIDDWAKYVMLHLKAAEGQPQLLKASSFAKLQTPITSSSTPYAMGWIVADADWAKGPVLTHAGSNELWYAKVWIAPKRDLAILVACNQGGNQAQTACEAAGLALMQQQLHLPEVKTLDPPNQL